MCPGSNQDNSNQELIFCNSQEGTWLWHRGYSTPPQVGWGEGSLFPGEGVSPSQGSVAELGSEVSILHVNHSLSFVHFCY